MQGEKYVLEAIKSRFNSRWNRMVVAHIGADDIATERAASLEAFLACVLKCVHLNMAGSVSIMGLRSQVQFPLHCP